MSILIAFLALVILMGAVLYIITPLVSREPDTRPEPELTDVEEEKERIYAAIKELEFDHETGKLSDDDFAALSATYKMRAVSILKEEAQPPDTPAAVTTADLEDLIRGRRAEIDEGAHVSVEDDLESLISNRKAELGEEDA